LLAVALCDRGILPEWLDFREGSISSLTVNGQEASTAIQNGHVELPARLLKLDENLVVIDFKAPVAPAVLAEAAFGAVGAEVVELTDQACIGPKAIDLEAVIADGEPSVQARARDVMGIEEGEELFLERAVDAAAGVIAQSIEASGDDRRASVPRIPLE